MAAKPHYKDMTRKKGTPVRVVLTGTMVQAPLKGAPDQKWPYSAQIKVDGYSNFYAVVPEQLVEVMADTKETEEWT